MALIPPKQDLAIAEETALRRFLSGREDQVFLVLTLLIGALDGLIVVAFILLRPCQSSVAPTSTNCSAS
jgi:hypothetical protein